MAHVQLQKFDPASSPCQTCSTSSAKTFTCIQCNSLAFCDACWPKWVLHTPGAIGWGGKPHEKADPVVIKRLREILEPVRTEAEHEAELIRDRETTWFGFSRDTSGHPIFQDWGRFAAIMNESHSSRIADRYPQLVSFIGETGAGKSTLIKLLIDRQNSYSSQTMNHYSPVSSSSNDYIPTTGDVHLYAEPSTLLTDTPLLFVDCEGFNGGEAMPKALRCHPQNERDEELPSERDMNNLLRSRYSSQRYITWAKSPQTQKREYAVSQLYPRILYTFSDVVVFVLRNPRSFESTVLDKLVRWGAASVDKSLNQPALPHAIIVLNATEDVDEKEWDVATATKTLISAIQGAIEREPALDEYVQVWRKRGKEIESTEDLLKQYYASITIIRIPRQTSYMLMDQQAEKLFNLIKSRCSDSHIKRKQARMLANSDMIQEYLQASFDHFTKDLELPFDFVQEALRKNPVSRSFEGNILNLAVSMRDHSKDKSLQDDANKLFLKLAPMVASCVMFDAVRQNRLGTGAQLLSNAYTDLCISALQVFADLYWPCNFRHLTNEPTQGRCCNVKSGHNPKGHQNKFGKIIGYGQYQSNFDLPVFIPKWNELIHYSLVKLQAAAYELGQKLPGRTDLQITSILHRERINVFYGALGNPSDFVSHSACFLCLRGLPECVLPCGHVLCLACVKTYGRASSRTTVELNRCPLHVREIMADPPWVVNIKPPYAGVRVLCLDSGGINGIVELKVLQAIEKILGLKLPIQHFFDLIVGTGAGGISSLGLGVMGGSINNTIKQFKALYQEAFTPREMIRIPLLKNLSSTYHGSIYKTKPLETALRIGFSEQNLFGDVQSRNEMSIKVAVTSTTVCGNKAVVFSNYNRPDIASQNLPYEFIRPRELSKEIKIWEAARATTAATPYFKIFQRAETGGQYVESSLRNACPVEVAQQEMKLIWSDVTNLPPDIMLSIGTGRSVKHRKTSLGGGKSTFPSPDASTSLSMSHRTTTRNTLSKLSEEDKTDDLICSSVWDKFMAGNFALTSSDTTGERQRYIRISPELNIPAPKFDDIQRIDEIDREAEEVLQQNMLEVKEIAHRLIASTFFFEKEVGSVKQTSSGYACKGSIYCRFRNSSEEMKGLGAFLKSSLKGNFEPYLSIEDDIPGSAARHIVLTGSAIRNMHQQGYFDMEPIQINALKEYAAIKITLCLQSTPYVSGEMKLPISGFPRQLMSEDAIHTGLYPESTFLTRQYSSKKPMSKASASDTIPPTNKVLSSLEPVAELPETLAPMPELPSEEI
ncbi:uncharacterized protein GGS22DRAFT_198203 [Annulohypoxylon maeteangense]|uniref:uncharacterized protein n=1 Tax=Annulohypoxylon maeteangense TaxID=1927788 RepID=UPI0020079992|nr:uncharacterized protein GGS22DRAFT_198203 [Annulohypoxylon maeteangense]KAI0888475.1 hypothetical protein GGS22DRAFT_198203 [Annulohypoxylon maeteangense]